MSASAISCFPLSLPQECYDNAFRPLTPAEPRSFCIGFIMTTIITANPIIGIAGGLVNTLASRIDLIIRPLLRDFVGQKIHSNHFQFALKSFAVITICNMLTFTISPIIGITLRINTLSSMIFKQLIYTIHGSNSEVWGPSAPLQVYGSAVRLV